MNTVNETREEERKKKTKTRLQVDKGFAEKKTQNKITKKYQSLIERRPTHRVISPRHFFIKIFPIVTSNTMVKIRVLNIYSSRV